MDGTLYKWDTNKKAEELQKELRKKDSTSTVTVNSNNLNVKYREYEAILNVKDGNITISKSGDTPPAPMTFAIGDMIRLGGENFFVIENSGENSSTVKLITAMLVDSTTNKQKKNATLLNFDDTDSTDVYANASIKTKVDNYVNELQARWGKTIDQARLLTFEDLETFGVTVPAGSPWCGSADLSNVPSFVLIENPFWTGSRDAVYASMTGVSYCPTIAYGGDGIVGRK